MAPRGARSAVRFSLGAVLRRSPWLHLAVPLWVGCAGDTPPPQADEPALEGTLRQFIADHADGSHEVGYALETDSGERVELELQAPPAHHAGERIRIAGSFVERARAARQSVRVSPRLFRVEALSQLERAGGLGRSDQAVVDGAPRNLRVAIVLLNFEGVSPQGFSPDQARSRIDEVRRYYQEISYGIWNLGGDVHGPYTVPRPADCGLGTIESLARSAASGAGVNLDDYDNVGVTLPSNGDSGLDCACGLAWVGRTPAVNNPGVQRFSLYTCTDPNAFAHEWGHNFGLGHASTANCAGQAYRRNIHASCSLGEYGNRFNTMGNGLGHFNGYQKSTFKWLDGCNTVRVAVDGTYDLVPIQLESEDVQVLQIATGDTRNGHPLYYYVEYRNPALATFNARDGNTVRERGIGLHVDVAVDYRNGDDTLNPLLLDVTPGSSGNFDDPRVKISETFQDPDGRVTVELLEASGEQAKVRVSFPNGGSGASLCADGSAPPGSDGPSAGVTLFQHCDFGGWAVSLVPGDYTRADLTALGVMDNDASSLSLREGHQAILFDGPDFTGNSVTLDATSACFNMQSFNDTLSSLRIVDLDPGDDDGSSDDGSSDDGSSDDGSSDDGSSDDGSTGDGDGDDGPTGDGDGDGDDGPAEADDEDDGEPTESDTSAVTTGHGLPGCSVGTRAAPPSAIGLLIAALAVVLRQRRKSSV
jgi:M6 family metalloprotease-like protein/MYXO-CTERM domain-containing protein